jgi:hypothetical protein
MFSGNLTGSNTCTFILLKEYEYYTYIRGPFRKQLHNSTFVISEDLDPLLIKHVGVCVCVYIHTHIHCVCVCVRTHT